MAVEGSASSGTTTSYGGMADARGGQGPGQGASTTSSDILFEQVIPVHIKVRRNRAFGERMRSAPGSLGLLRSFDSQRPQTSIYPVATVSRATALDHDDSLAPCFAPLFFPRSSFQEHDKQERIEQLGFRISLCTTQEGHNMVKVEKVLKLQLTSEKDSFFLHSLEVTEDSFQRLKHDQSILVDFTDFPSHLIALLENCIEAKQDVQPKFLCCVLSTAKPKAAAAGAPSVSSTPGSGSPNANIFASADLSNQEPTSVVGIVETNQFKHLCHISMKFQPGNDARIKDYLSQRLSEVRASNAGLRATLKASVETVEALEADSASLRKDLDSEQLARREQTTKWSTEKQGLLTDCKQELLTEVSEMRERHEAEKKAMETDFKAQNAKLADTNADLAEKLRALQDEKFNLDAKSRELAVRVSSLEADLKAARQAETELKQANSGLDSGKHEAEKENNHLMLKLAGLEATMKEKEEVLGTLRRQLQSGEQSSSALQGSFAEMKLALQRSEERSSLSAQEVSKGNQIIDKLQQDLKSSRAKLKLKSQVIQQQENLLQEKQAAIDALHRDDLISKSQVKGLEAEKGALNRTCEDQKEKLAEAKKLLDQNQQMIQWRN